MRIRDKAPALLAVWTLALVTSGRQHVRADGKIAIGPYVQDVTPRSAVVCWATLSGESKVVGPDGKSQVLRHYDHHEIELAGLKPDTTYTYDVLGTGAPEGKGSFTSFPGGAEPFRFTVVGDTRSNHEVHAKIVERMMADKPRLVKNSGDLISDGRNIAHWEKFFEINRELMRSIPYYPVLGNHEKNGQLYFDFFHLPEGERYYMFTVGDALFLMLDLDGPYLPTPTFMDREEREAWWRKQSGDYFERQKAWVRNRLELTRGAGFVFVVFHLPLYSSKASRLEGTKERRAFWGDLFERYKVQVVLSGHDHHYHRAVHGGTHYVTTAGGGAGLYDNDAPQPESVKWKKAHHYVVVDVRTDDAVLKAVEMDGSVIETFTIKRRGR